MTGPLMPYGEHDRLADAGAAVGVDVHRFLPELRGHVAAADCLVAMPGYNTVCDILSYRSRAVLVPRHSQSLEQPIRARRLRELGLAQVLTAHELEDGDLAGAVERALASELPPTPPIALNGLQAAVDVFDGKHARVRAA